MTELTVEDMIFRRIDGKWKQIVGGREVGVGAINVFPSTHQAILDRLAKAEDALQKYVEVYDGMWHQTCNYGAIARAYFEEQTP